MTVSRAPRAFWPLEITAGVNDYIDFTINGGAEMSARIAAGVYLSITSLLAACETAVNDEALDAGTTFVAVALSDAAASSPDGTTWTAQTPPAGDYVSVAWNGTVFAAVGVAAAAATSPDGVTWTDRTIPAGNYYSVIWTGSLFVAVGQSVAATSPDGTTWTSRTIPAGTYWGAAWSGSLVVAVGSSVIATSVDGTTWTARTSPAMGFTGVAWGGGTFAAVALAGDAATSTDGISWEATSITLGVDAAVAWNGSLFAAVGNSTAATSSDGVTWTERTIPAGTYRSVAWNGTVFVAVGQAVAATSPDGITWTSRTIPAADYYGVAWDSAPVALASAVSSSGKVTLTTLPGTELLLSTGSNAATSARDVLGFGTVDTASGATHTATLQHQNGWYPEKPCVFDSREEYERVSAGTVALSGATKSVVYGSPQLSRRVDFAWLPEWKTKIAREGTHTNEALERLWKDGYARFRYWPDGTDDATYADWVIDPEDLSRFAPARDDRMQLYAYSLRMRKYV